MKILAIETSCDETAIAILDCKGTIKNPSFDILSSIVSSQIKIHAKWGGVVPNLAKREHIKNLPLVLKKALAQAKIKKEDVGAIAVTTGPGLEPALWTGINFTQELAAKWSKPVIATNHMEGHIVSSLLETSSKVKSKKLKVKFPAMALLVSGGHTELVLVNNWRDYQMIGETLDDAAGEAFDKLAKMLGLPYPGGPVVSKLASQHIPDPKLLKEIPKLILPRPMINSKNYNFSFSGLKTAALYLIRDIKKINKKITKAICYEFQQAIIDTLISKTIRATKEYEVKSVILGGGVAANKELRAQLENAIKNYDKKIGFFVPAVELTGDNAAMIGAAAYFKALKKDFASPSVPLKADGNMTLK